MKKFFTILAALLAMALLGIGFVSCSDDDKEDSSGSSSLATFKTEKDKSGMYSTFKFFSDNTWAETSSDSSATYTMFEGTYSGNPKSDGDISATITKVSTLLVDENATEAKLIDANSDEAATFRREWGNLTGTISISNEKFTFANQTFYKE